MAKIVLDAGHGGTDPGAVYEGRQEKDDVLQLVFDVGAVLENNGIDVEYTRVTDVYQSPYEKAAMANQSGADYFVSIHRNARDVPNTEGGVETLLYSTEDSVKKDMAESINRNLEEIGFTNRGVIARPNLVVLRDTDMPALLVEAGFIDSEADNALYDANRAAIADAIAYGILEGLPKEEAQGDEEENAKAIQTNVKEISRGDAGKKFQTSEDTEETIRTNAKEIFRGDAGEKLLTSEDTEGSIQANVKKVPQGDEREAALRDVKKETYRVQVGVYRNPTNARMMLNRLEIRGHRAYMLHRNGLYYVEAGAYPNLASAVAEEKRLKNAGFQTLIVTG